MKWPRSNSRAALWCLAVFVIAIMILGKIPSVDAGGLRSNICSSALSDHHVQRVRVVERVVDPYAYDVGYQYRASQRARDDSIAELAALKLLRTQYQLELQQLRSGVQSPPRNAPPAALQPGKQDTSDLPLEQLHASVTATVTKSCLRCHDGKNENVVNLSDLSALSPLQTWEVFAQVYLGHMPKNGTKLSDQQAETFMKYAIAATRK